MSSSTIYGTVNGIWTTSSMIKNGGKQARNMKGEHLLSTYGQKGAFAYMYASFFGTLSLAASGVGGGAAVEEENILYHYCNEAKALNASETGLRVGQDGFSYLTNNGNLSPFQAQLELALPVNRISPSSLLRIDVSGMQPELIRRVTGNLPGYGVGGGTEFLFNQTINPSRITMIR